MKPENIKYHDGYWNDLEQEETVLLASDLTDSISVLVDKYKAKLRI